MRSVGILLVAFVAGCSGAAVGEEASDTSEGAVIASPKEAAAEPVTLTNFATHPDVLAARDLSAELESKIKGGALREEKRTGLCPEGGEDSRAKYSAGAKIRVLKTSGGMEDSVESQSFYYDEAGKLRLAYSRQSGALGCDLTETRQYFGAHGEPLIAVRRHVAGEAPEGFDACSLSAKLAEAKDELVREAASELPAHVVDDPQSAWDPAVTTPQCER